MRASIKIKTPRLEHQHLESTRNQIKSTMRTNTRKRAPKSKQEHQENTRIKLRSLGGEH